MNFELVLWTFFVPGNKTLDLWGCRILDKLEMFQSLFHQVNFKILNPDHVDSEVRRWRFCFRPTWEYTELLDSEQIQFFQDHQAPEAENSEGRVFIRSLDEVLTLASTLLEEDVWLWATQWCSQIFYYFKQMFTKLYRHLDWNQLK